jgi:antitoxin (DNA-binding transcriptional repressor) of toxin-antitoxin stability system
MTRIQPAFLDPALQEALRLVADGERVLLEVDGHPIAALVPLDDAAALEDADERTDLEACQLARREPGSIPLQDVLRELELED